MRGHRGLIGALSALGVTFSLGVGSCAGTPLPENYLNEIFAGDPVQQCGKWLDVVSDLYIERMHCQGSSLAHSVREEVEYQGRKWTPIQVSHRSLESLLAPLVGAESLFKDAKTGQPRDLYEGSSGIVRAIVPEGWARLQIEKDPPVALVAMDLALAPARDEFDAEWKKLGPDVWAPSRRAARLEIQSNGPFQRAFLPVARLLRERCSAQIGGGASLIARITQDPACHEAFPIDPFLRALLGPRAGQQLTVPEAAQETAASSKQLRALPAGAGAPSRGSQKSTPESGAAR